MLDKLQQTNHALRVALEDQLQRNTNTKEKTFYNTDREEYDESQWHNIPQVTQDYNSPNFGYDNLHPLLTQEQQPTFTKYTNHSPSPTSSPSPSSLSSHSRPSYSHSPSHTSSSPSPSHALSSPSPSHSHFHSPSYTQPTNHLRKELDNLDVEIEHLQASLKRQLLEMSSPH